MRLLISISSQPKHLSKNAKVPRVSRKVFDNLTPADKKRYLKAFPNSSYGSKASKKSIVTDKKKAGSKPAAERKLRAPVSRKDQKTRLIERLGEAEKVLDGAKAKVKSEIAKIEDYIKQAKEDLKTMDADDRAELKAGIDDDAKDLQALRKAGGSNRFRRKLDEAQHTYDKLKGQIAKNKA